jgi:YHS domain-containing protein
MTRNFIIATAFSLFTLSAVISCQSSPSGQASAAQDAAKAADSALAARKAALKMLAFDYKKDPSCGMPLTAGVEDTLHYKGKLYGFCSKECKDAFLKDPASYVAQAK